MKNLLLISFLFFTTNVFAQADVAAKYGAGITGAQLKKHLLVIAGDAFEGRETGTKGQRLAAEYIQQQFAAIGLKQPQGLKNYQQYYPLQNDTVLQASLIINGVAANNLVDYLVPLQPNNTTKYKAKEIVFAGYGINDVAYNDYANLNVKGKVVLIFLGEPKKDGKFFIGQDGKTSQWTYPGISAKVQAAAEKGAAGVLVVNPNMEVISQRYINANTKSNLTFESMPTENENGKINYAIISHAFAKTFLATQFDSLLSNVKNKNAFINAPIILKTKVQLEFKKTRNIVQATNVIGIVEGTDKKDEYVFITAHYDHLGIQNEKIYYGADDDGSGTVGVLQMAEAFAKAASEGKGPRRTVVFMAVSGEEKGLWGSEYYSDHPIYPLAKTSVDLNIDMVGRVDTERKTADTLNYIYVVGHNKISSEMPIINEAANAKYTNLVLDYKFDDPNDPNRIYYRSDHYNFARKGVPVLFFYDGMLKADYHKPTDTVDKINFELCEKRVRMIFYTAWEIANRDNLLNRDKPLDAGSR